MNKKTSWMISIFLSFVLLLSSCGKNSANFNLNGSPKIDENTVAREFPSFNLSPFDTMQPVTKESDGKTAIIDTSNSQDGYVVAATNSGVKTKFRVQKGEHYYNYDLASDGTFEVFPLSMGEGMYTFTVYHNIQGSEYSIFLTKDFHVTLHSEFEPFLRPNQIVNYTQDYEFINFTYELTKHAKTKEEIVAIIYYWITENMSYDYDMAANISSYAGYIPNVDAVLERRIGICYDYSALFAAMLRINGIPCKLIMGDVNVPGKDTIYHGWNEIWLESTGWISVELASAPEEWMRIDSTFVSGNRDMEEFSQQDIHYINISAH